MLVRVYHIYPCQGSDSSVLEKFIKLLLTQALKISRVVDKKETASASLWQHAVFELLGAVLTSYT